MSHEGLPRIHEDTYEDGHHSKWHDIYMEYGMTHHQRSRHCEERQQHIDHGNRAGILVIVAPKDPEIDGKTNNEQRNVEYFA